MTLAALLCGTGWLVVGRRSVRGGPPNLILISLDTCRADRLSCYGHPRQTTPHIDAVAREGILFENAVSPVPITLPAHSSILTGTIPPYHGVHDNINYRLGDSNVTLAEVLRENGYRTAAVIGAFVLDSQTGIDQGFDSFDDRLIPGGASAGRRPERRAEEVSRLANAWLSENSSTPFFLFLHYYDPHDPYTPPEPFASTFADDPYAGEVAYTDQAVGQVMKKLEDLDLYDSSIIIIVGDHGESLGEHGESTHGYFVYHSTTKVPLIVKLPGRRRARRVDQTVSLVDILPTVLSQLNLPLPETLQGEDLSPLFSNDVPDRKPRHIYSESMLATKYDCNSLLAVETRDWKYIQTSRPELYDLRVDPDELHNVLDEQPGRAGFLQERLRSMLAEHSRVGRGESTASLDAESLARLRSLGYTGGPVRESYEFDTALEDPKDFVEIHTRLESMDQFQKKKDYDGARRVADEILAIRPDFVEVHKRLGLIAVEQDDTDAGITHYSAALRLAPDSPDAPLWHNNLGILVRRKDRLDEAIEHFNEALRLVESAVEDSNDQGDGRTVNRGVWALRVSAHMNLGETFTEKGKFAQAADEFRRAVKLAPDNPAVHHALSGALSNLGRRDEATAEFREAARLQQKRLEARRAGTPTGGGQ